MFWVDHERIVRLLCFLVVFGLMAYWELKTTLRAPSAPRKVRWNGNLCLTVLNTLVIRLLFPGAGLWAALWASRHGLGLFNKIEEPGVFAVLFTLVFLDWVVYYLHRAYHALPFFWKFHRVHHSDTELDVSTGVRFHPVEMLFTMLFKSAFIIILGAPLEGVLLYEVLFNISSLFSHGNVGVKPALEKSLRHVFVTPEMHLVHHSAVPAETNSNFGFVFSIWDKFLGTYKAQTEAPPEAVKIGLENFREPAYQRIGPLLLMPFYDKQGFISFKNLIRRD